MKSKPVVAGDDSFHGSLLLSTEKESAGSLRDYLGACAQHGLFTRIKPHDVPSPCAYVVLCPAEA